MFFYINDLSAVGVEILQWLESVGIEENRPNFLILVNIHKILKHLPVDCVIYIRSLSAWERADPGVESNQSESFFR